MIFGFGKKKPTPTFKDRVTEFWNWYTSVADRFYQVIEQGNSETLVAEVSPVAERTLPGLSWVFGPGENEGHSFTVSGEGQLPKQLLADYWHSRAPKLPHWTFHASRQPSPPERIQGLAMGVSEHENIEFDKVLINPQVDEESQIINVVVWHPLFEAVPEQARYQIAFIMLDEALGEFGTQTWLGEIKIGPFTAGKETRSLDKLGTFVEQVKKFYKWEKLPPVHSYSGYQIKEQTKGPRGDTIVGTTRIPDLIGDFLNNKGRLSEDPLKGTGAEFAYVAIDRSVFPEGQETDVRAKIEDSIQEALEKELSGQTLGGAFGLNKSYIDLLLFDGANSRQIVENTLASLQLHGRSEVKSFT